MSGERPPAFDAGQQADATPDCTVIGQLTDPACDEPPPASCVDAETRELYANHGACVDGQCVYVPLRRSCFGGCTAEGCIVCPGGEAGEDLPRLDQGEPERLCWPATALRDATDFPHLTSNAANDAGSADRPDECPGAAELEWGSFGETCAYRPECDAPVTGTPGARSPECCYIVHRVCGV
ncbi:MAG: hypothetical protein PVI30_23865 [Myxococcales bacterium]